MLFLKQSTAATVKIGPFLDSGDGVTAEDGLTIAQADVRLSKNGGAFAQKNNATSCTHDENGWYGCPLSTTDTNTLGTLQLSVQVSGALPVWHEFMVLPANVYDSLIAGSDYLQADAVQVEGSDATDQINAACDTALTDYDAVVPADLNDPTAAAIADAVWDEALADHNTEDTIGNVIGDLVDEDVGGVYQFTVNALENAPSGSGASAETIADAVWDEAIGDHSEAGSTGEALSGASAPTAAQVADAVWDEAATGHTDAGKAGTQLWTDVDAILADTAEIGAAGAGLTAVPWNAAWDAEVQSEAADALTAYDPPTKAELDSGLAGLNDPTAAQVADAVWDEAKSGHTDAGSFGEEVQAHALSSEISAAESSIRGADSDTLKTLSDQLDNVSSEAGAGAITYTYTLTSSADGSPIAEADVWVTNDQAGNSLLASGRTNSSGQVTFYLDEGTVYIWRQKAGWNFTNPQTVTIS